MRFEIDFTERYEFSGEVYDGINLLGKARLKFGDGSAIQLTMELSTYTGSGVDSYNRLVLKTPDGDIFTLFNCRSVGVFFILSDFIVVGDIEDNFYCIKIRFLEMSDWFFQGRYISGEYGDSLKWENNPSQIDVTINSSEPKFNLVTESDVRSKIEGDSFIISECVFFVIKSLGQGFSVKEIENKAIELPTLLTILLGQPLSIINIMVSSNDSRFSYSYLPVYKVYNKNHRYDGFWLRCILQKRQLDETWQDIFDKYYTNVCQDLIWRKLSGMHRYEGFWEYKFLGYISLLEKYVSKYSLTNGFTPKRKKKLTDDDINNIVNLCSLGLSDQQKECLSAELKSITTDKSHFSDRFDHALSSTDKDIIEIINLKASDVKFIVDRRNDIAHGDDIKIRPDEYQNVTVTLNKVILLMTYWVLNILGIKKDNFIKSLNVTHNSICLGAIINKKHIERIRGDAEFISVSRIEFDNLSKIKRKTNCCLINEDGYEYSEELTEIYRKYIETPGRPLNESIGYIFGVDDNNIFHKFKVYIEHDLLELCFNDVVIITKKHGA